MEYNTLKIPLIYPEYGRNLLKLINNIIKIKNFKVKLINLKNILKLMININKKLKIDFIKNKIGIQLFILSNKKILINNKIKNLLKIKSNKKIEFIIFMKKKIINNKFFKYKYYGNNIRIILFFISKNKKNKIFYLNKLLNLMKKKYLKWNSINYIRSNIIYNEIFRLTIGRINILNFIYLKKKLY